MELVMIDSLGSSARTATEVEAERIQELLADVQAQVGAMPQTVVFNAQDDVAPINQGNVVYSNCSFDQHFDRIFGRKS